MDAKPHFPAGCRIAARYDAARGYLRVCMQPPVRIPVATGVNAYVGAVGWGVGGGSEMRGSLCVYGVPVGSLALLPQRLWSDKTSAHALMQEAWRTLVEPVPDPGFHAPATLHADGVARDGCLDLHLHAAWHEARHDAHVAQHILLDGAGDATRGAGQLTFTGDVATLSRFIDTQLLPFVGEVPQQHLPCVPRHDTIPVRASAAWRPNGTQGFAARARLKHSLWEMHGHYVQHADACRFTADIAGNPASVLNALRDVHLPRIAAIDNLAAHTDAATNYARAWTLSRRAWETADAALQLRGMHDNRDGVRGSLTLRLHYGARVDTFDVGIGPRRGLLQPARKVPNLQDEAGPLALPDIPTLDPAMHALRHAARFVVGGRADWSAPTLRALGAAPAEHDLWLTLRHYGREASAMVPLTAARSLWAAWAATATAPSRADDDLAQQVWSTSA